MHEAPKTVAGDVDPRAAFFNELAPRWDETGQDPCETVMRVAEHAELLRLAAGEDLLEVGCGTAQLTGWLASRVSPGSVVAVDFAPAMLEAAHRKGVAADFRLADVCQDELGESCYDVVLCFHSFPHFRDQAAAVANLARALRDAGRLLVMHLAGSAQINAFHDQVGGAVGGDHLPSRDRFERLLAAAGLTIRQHIDREGLFFLEACRSL
ncbi:MAG: methyltransferase domain-containing protein [Planctomycetes bacterium]|nr:methyltransferase domain-containing protein [Planctomycetota bacterium]